MSTILAEVSEAVSEVATAASSSVVGVGRGGSGVVVGDGLVLTNAHNLRGDLTVAFADGRSEPATVAGTDIDGDLAVLAVVTGGVPAMTWTDREGPVELGELVVSLSRPRGHALRAGVGFVSGLELAFRGPEGRSITGALAHSALLPSGSSGGPVLDAQGRLVAVNTHRPEQGGYLAIPAGRELKARVDALGRGESPRRVRLGVALAPPKVARHLRSAVGLPDREGLLVHDVDPNGPAGRSGVRRGDLIVSVGGEAVTTVDQLAAALAGASEAASVDLGVVRGSEEVQLSVHFDQANAPGPEEGTA